MCSSVIKEMRIKTTMRYLLASVRVAAIKKTRDDVGGWDAGKGSPALWGREGAPL